MEQQKFELGADVFTGSGRGEVLEARWINDSQWIYGVVSANGDITYHEERALKRAS